MIYSCETSGRHVGWAQSAERVVQNIHEGESGEQVHLTLRGEASRKKEGEWGEASKRCKCDLFVFKNLS